MIERDFDVAFIADLALREKQIQQNYRPIIAVHKWFARRPGALFRGLLLAEYARGPLREAYFRANDLSGLRVADPFMGGGTPLVEANRLGCDVLGFDINPMSLWIVRQEIERLDLAAYVCAATELRKALEQEVGALYRTRCAICDSPAAHVKYFLWVKAQSCRQCGADVDLFPGYLLAADSRHPQNVFVCGPCGGLTETPDRQSPGPCAHCGRDLAAAGPARRSRCVCAGCGHENAYPDPQAGPPRHRLFALEYHCPQCRPGHAGRFFKAPDAEDLSRAAQAEARWAGMEARFAPDAEIPSGDETDRLHRWGYRRYAQMFNPRQLLGLELICRSIAGQPDERVRNALATNLSDLLRYQNMLCRYDTVALKSLDVFSVHGFPVGLVQCESNLLGIVDPGRRACVGSGGWANIVDKFAKAKKYCDEPFEVRHQGKRRVVVPVPGEWIGDVRGNGAGRPRSVQLACADAAREDLDPASLDGVFTDPPYFGNVQYAELMDFCYVWLRRLVGEATPGFAARTTRTPHELTGNAAMSRGVEHFTAGLSAVFVRMAGALKPGRPLAFTYHHNAIEAYLPVAVAILDSGLACSGSLPCPAEMSASIHINGTGSSIIDTVFVCRSTGTVPRAWLAQTPAAVAALVRADLEALRRGAVSPTPGDIRCIAYGHLVRLAVWDLRQGWDREAGVAERLRVVRQWLDDFGGWLAVEAHLKDAAATPLSLLACTVAEEPATYGATDARVSF